MKIIKYKQGNNYCLVHKNNFFSYFLLQKNNKYYYYEKILNKNYNKTHEIASRLLSNKNIEIDFIEIDTYEVLYKMCKFHLKNENEDHFCIITETLGNKEFITFRSYKNNKIVDTMRGLRHSATFLVPYFDYKMISLFPENTELLINWKDVYYNNSQSQHLIDIMSKKEIYFYKRYFRYLFHLYQKMEFTDLYVDFDFATKSKNLHKFFINLYEYYDKIIGVYFEKIIKKLDLKDKFVYFYEYFKYYFPFLNIIFYLKEKEIKNQKVLIYSCAFLLEHAKTFLDDKNEYIINNAVILREKMLLFIDENISKTEIESFINDKEKIRTKKIKKAFKTMI